MEVLAHADDRISTSLPNKSARNPPVCLLVEFAYPEVVEALLVVVAVSSSSHSSSGLWVEVDTDVEYHVSSPAAVVRAVETYVLAPEPPEPPEPEPEPEPEP